MIMFEENKNLINEEELDNVTGGALAGLHISMEMPFTPDVENENAVIAPTGKSAGKAKAL